MNMKPTATEVQQLYIAYFNRPAEPEGLQYWTSVDATPGAIAAAFAASPEFTQRYANMSNKDMVKAMYHNLFGRAGDAGGVAYWSGLLDSGAVKPDNVALALLRGAQGGDATVLANKAALAQEWTASVKVLLPYVADRDVGPISALWLEQVTDAASLQNARAALAKYLASPGTSTIMVSGQAQGVGYLRDATVFIDSNGDGMLGATELATRTDANGHFLLAASSMADFPQSPASWDQHIVVTGGYDLATGRAHNGTLSLTFTQQHSGGYPATTLVRATASAMTALRDALVRTGTAAGSADAVLATAFGVKISPATDSLTAAFDADSGARAAPLSVNAIHAEIDAIAEVVARTLQMLSARLPAGGIKYEPPKLSLDAAMRAAYDSLAGVLAAAKGGVSLESGATVLQVLNNAAAALLLKADGTIVTSPGSLSSATLDAFKQIMGAALSQARAGIGDSADTYATLAHITQVRGMLDELADTLPRAMAENKAAALLPQWTEAAIKAKVAAIDVGDIDPYSQNDSAAIAQTNGTPPALDKLAVEQVYVAMLNRPAAPDALQKWMAQGDAAALAAELATLPEWQGKGSDALAVNTLYTNLFGRGGDTDGLLYWTGVLRDQKIDLATLARYLANGATGSDAVTVRNKVVGAAEYTSALATPELADAYRGNPTAGKYWITGISDNATLKNALDLLPDFLVSNGPVTLTGVQDPALF
jgi:hypothetical protein